MERIVFTGYDQEKAALNISEGYMQKTAKLITQQHCMLNLILI